MGATFWSSPSGDLSCHFDPSPLGKGLHHHVEVAGRWCRWKLDRTRGRLTVNTAWEVGQAVTRSSLKQVWGSNLGPVNSDTVLPTVRYRSDISKEAMLPGRNDAEMGPANSLHASVYYSEYIERFDFLIRNNYRNVQI